MRRQRTDGMRGRPGTGAGNWVPPGGKAGLHNAERAPRADRRKWCRGLRLRRIGRSVLTVLGRWPDVVGAETKVGRKVVRQHVGSD